MAWRRVWNSLSAFTIRNAGYQKLGLRRQDIYRETPDVKEAIRRLPETEKNLRNYRIKRALDLSLKHRILPREQWTSEEEDVLYLSSYLDEVMAEMKEQKKWNTQ